MAGYAPLPQYQYPANALIDFSPVNQGINALGDMWKNNRRVDQFEQGLASAAGMPGMRPEMMDLARSLGPEHGPNALFQAYNAAQQRAASQAQLAEQMRQHNSTIALQQQQLRLQQQQEARNAEMTPYEIAIKKAQAQNSEIDSQMMRAFMPPPAQAQAPSTDPGMLPGQAPPLPPPRGPNGAPMPQGGPPNMLAPRAPLAGPQMGPQSGPLPGPQMQPQSGDGFDPSMVRPIADAPSMTLQPAPAPSPNMIRTPFGEMPVERAQQMAGLLALRGKNEAAKLMEKAIEQAGMGKHGQGKVEEKAFSSGELSARLDEIAGKYTDKFQTYETGFKMKAISWLDSFEATRNKVPPEDRKAFEEYTQFRRSAVDNLTQYIKEVTGAAMGVQEEKRIRQGMPDPMKDSPTEFRAKLTDTMRSTKAALARYNYLISQGYDAKALMASKDKIESMIKIDDMPRIINQRGATLKQQIMAENPRADGAQVDQFVAQRIKREFGI